jgi:hypothetical protein
MESSRQRRIRVTLPRRTLCIAALICISLSGALARSKDEKKEKSKPQAVDSGAFQVIVKGQHVITETFSIEQENGISIVKAQLKEVAGTDPVMQKSVLEFTPQGQLVLYEWSQPSGGSLTVAPNNEFLLEKITAPGATKAAEQPFLMPSSSVILDNNFFIQREVLAWRYLAADCKSEGGNLQCQQGPAEFGVLVPQDRTSMSVRMELVGKEKVQIHGANRDLLRLNLLGENFHWSLWLDDQDHFKLMRVLIPSEDTEVVRE